MKFKLLILLLIFINLGCNKDEDNATPSPIVILDQDLTGKINNGSWTYTNGHINTTFYDNKFTHSFKILDLEPSDSCFPDRSDNPFILFSIRNDNSILLPGNHPLNLDPTSLLSENDVAVVFVYNGVTSPVNTVVSEGSYEILTVDTSNQIVTGQMDARLNGQNYLNGQFRVKYCKWE